jgi:spermidine/putrescine-binding protein
VEYAGRQIQAGIFQPLDKSRLPILKHRDFDVLHALEAADPGNRHLVPYMWYTTGVAINVEKVAKALAARCPTTPGNCCSTRRSPRASKAAASR